MGRGTCAPPSPPARMLSRSTRKSPSRRIGRKPRTTWGLPIWVSGSGCGGLRRRRACAPPSPPVRVLCGSEQKNPSHRIGRRPRTFWGPRNWSLGQRLSGTEGARVYVPPSPSSRPLCQSNLGIAYQDLGERQSGSVEGRACAPRRNRLSECFADPNKKRLSHRRVRLGTMSRARVCERNQHLGEQGRQGQTSSHVARIAN